MPSSGSQDDGQSDALSDAGSSNILPVDAADLMSIDGDTIDHAYNTADIASKVGLHVGWTAAAADARSS